MNVPDGAARCSSCHDASTWSSAAWYAVDTCMQKSSSGVALSGVSQPAVVLA